MKRNTALQEKFFLKEILKVDLVLLKSKSG